MVYIAIIHISTFVPFGYALPQWTRHPTSIVILDTKTWCSGTLESCGYVIGMMEPKKLKVLKGL
jgi:hypothetical protein